MEVDFDVVLPAEADAFDGGVNLVVPHYHRHGSELVFVLAFAVLDGFEPNQPIEFGCHHNPSLISHLKQFHYILLDLWRMQQHIAGIGGNLAGILQPLADRSVSFAIGKAFLNRCGLFYLLLDGF